MSTSHTHSESLQKNVIRSCEAFQYIAQSLVGTSPLFCKKNENEGAFLFFVAKINCVYFQIKHNLVTFKAVSTGTQKENGN